MYTYYPNICIKDSFHNNIESGYARMSRTEDKRICKIVTKHASKPVYVIATDENTYRYICGNISGTSSVDRVVNFTINDDETITLIDANYWGRHLKSANNLKQFVHEVEYYAWGIITDKIVEF